MQLFFAVCRFATSEEVVESVTIKEEGLVVWAGEYSNRNGVRVVHFQTVLKNIFSTWVGYLVTLGTGFLLAPFVVHHLGATGYGVWTLVASLTGYFGMLDLGLRQSVGRYVARYMALEDYAGVNRTVSNALAMLGAAGTLGFLAAITANFTFGVFHVDQQLQIDARIALLIAGLNISLALPMSVFNAVLFALERFDVVTAITIAGSN